MQVFKLTSDVARALEISESRMRMLRRRGDLTHSARTTKGDPLYSDDDISRAKEQLADKRKPQ